MGTSAGTHICLLSTKLSEHVALPVSSKWVAYRGTREVFTTHIYGFGGTPANAYQDLLLKEEHEARL